MDDLEKAVRFWFDKYFETSDAYEEHLYAKQYLSNFFNK